MATLFFIFYVIDNTAFISITLLFNGLFSFNCKKMSLGAKNTGLSTVTNDLN